MSRSTRIAIVLFLCAGIAAAAGPEAAARAATIPWNPCYSGFGAPFECATVHVPLDYDDPGVATVQIALVRLPASDPAQRIGSIFFNPGGPGGSGVDLVLGLGPYLYSQQVRERFDLVGFDPRGVGRSKALRCFGTPRQWQRYFTPFAFPITREEQRIWDAADRYLVSACERRGSRLIDHMSTADVARDLDVMRDAVGDDGLTFVGYSYGSYLGVTYANLFPGRVRAIVVDGVIDPVAWATGAPGEGDTIPFLTRIRSADGAQATLDEFFRLCEASPSQCAFSGGAAARFAALADQLRETPIDIVRPDGLTFRFTYQDLISTTLGALYDSFSWRSLARLLATLESLAPAPELRQNLQAVWEDLGLINKRGFPHYPNSVEAYPGVGCADSDNPDDPDAWWDAALESELESGYFGPIWTWSSSLCSLWPGEQIGRYTGPFDANTAHPVLVVNNTFDPATRYESAQIVAGLLPSSRLLTVSAWGHVSVFLSQCADQAVSRYLLDGTLPPEGAVCNQDFRPFGGFGRSSASGPQMPRTELVPLVVPDAVRKLARKRR
jgi:pimeloyl-ACP methyl ester carboxylesterase